MRRPMRFLALGGTILGGHTTTAESKLLDNWVFNCTASIADAIATLLLVCMRRS
jgi:phage portal protein BeeE